MGNSAEKALSSRTAHLAMLSLFLCQLLIQVRAQEVWGCSCREFRFFGTWADDVTWESSTLHGECVDGSKPLVSPRYGDLGCAKV